MRRFAYLIMILICLASCHKSNPMEVIEMSSPARWTGTPVIVEPTPAGARGINTVNRVGCFQKQALEDSDGYTYVVVAEDDKAGGTLRIAVYKSTQPNKTFTGLTSDYAFQADTTIANGYDANSILNLREFAVDLRLNKIHIAFIYDIGGGAYHTGYTVFNINNNTFISVILCYAETTYDPARLCPRSVSISCSESGCLRDINKRDVGHGSVWIGRIASTSFNSFEGGGINFTPIYDEFKNNQNIQSDTWGICDDANGVNSPNQMQSMFDGGTEIYSVICTPAGLDYWTLPIWHELLSDLGAPVEFWNFKASLIYGAIDASSVLYNFGCWDACYIDAFNYQVMAKWLRNAGGTGWDLHIGWRNQNGFVNSCLVYSVDYANLGVADIETELENAGIFPECCLSVDENGRVFVYALFPSKQNNPLGTTGPGAIDSDPYTVIGLCSFSGDGIYAPSNLDLQMVWDPYAPGIVNHRALKYISAPHRTDSQDLPMADEVLWFTVNDRLPIAGDTRNSQLVFFRN